MQHPIKINAWLYPVTRISAVIGIFMLTTYVANAQQVSAKLDKSSIRIGEQVKLQLSVTYNKRDAVSKLTWPVLKDSINSKIEIVSQSAVQKSEPDKVTLDITESKNLVITSFDSGSHTIPVFKIYVNGDTTNVIDSKPLLLEVHTLPVDTTKAIKDIKGIHEVPFAFEDIQIYVLIGTAVLLLAAVGYWLFRKNKIKPIVIVPKAPPVLPHVEALNRLEKLRADKLWQTGQEKRYHSSISDILREYISKRFPVNAMELTTDEIMLRFKKINILREYKEQLYQVLFTSDMVKFAKEQPLPGENEQCLELAISFIKNTMPIAQTVQKQPGIQAEDNG